MPSLSQKSHSLAVVAGVLLACTWASPLFGQWVWNGSASGEFDTSANWTPAGVPGSGNSVLFNSAGGGHTLIDLPSDPVTVKNIEFDTSSCAAYTIGTPGEQLHLNGPEYFHGAITLDAGVTQNQTFAADLRLNGDGSDYGIYNIVNNSSASLNITGAIAPSGGKTYYLELMGSGSGINTLSGVMNDGGTLVEMQVDVMGGTWALTGANTFLGGVYISGGTLVANSIGNGGQTSSLGKSANDWTNLSFNGSSGTVDTLRYTGPTASTDRNFFINKGVTAIFDITEGDLTFTGGAAGGSGGGNLTKTGAAMLVLNGVSRYSGATTISEGVLSASSIANGGKASSIGEAGVSASNLVFDGGTLIYTGGTTTTDRSFSITAGKVAVINIANPGTQLTLNAAQVIPGTTGGLTKTGPGTLMFYGAAYYTGQTTVAEGTLAAVVNNAFSGSSGISIAAGATLDLSIGHNTIGPLSGEAGSRLLTWQTTISTSTNATFGGVISGSTGLVKTAPGGVGSWGGMQTLTGANTYTGTTFIWAAGTPNFPTSQPGGITLSGADGSITSSSAIQISGDAILAIENFGSATKTNRISPTAPITMSGGTLSFQTDSKTPSISETIGALTLTGGYNTIENGYVSYGKSSILTITSLTRTGGATVNFSGQSLGFAGSQQNRIMFTNAPVLGEWALYNGVGYAAYDATYGIVEAAYADVTRLSSGEKVINSASQGNLRVIDGTGTTGAITLNDPTTSIWTLTQSATGGPVTIDTSGKTFALASVLVGTGAGGLTIGTAPNSGTLTAASDAVTLINNSTNNLLVNTTLVDVLLESGPFSIPVTKTGTGTALLAGANSYTGVTTLEQGVLSVATIGNGGTAGNLGAAGSAAANLVFTGGTLCYTGTDATTNRGFTVLSSGSRFETSANFHFSGTGINLAGGALSIGGTGNTTITSVMSGPGALVKDGPATLTLQGSNPFTGGVTISGGTVSVASLDFGGQPGNLGAASNASANLVLDGGTLAYTGIGGSGITDRGMTVTANGGTLVVPNADTYLDFTIGSTNDIALANGATFTVDGLGWVTLQNAITGLGAVRKTGAGTLRLYDAMNTFTGGVTLSGGTLGVTFITDGGAPGDLGAATADPANLVFDGGTLSFDGGSTSDRGFTITAGKTATINVETDASLLLSGSVPATTGGITKTGNGTLAFTGNLACTGGVLLSGGTLGIQAITNGGVAGNLGAATADPANLVFDGGTLSFGASNSAPQSTDRGFTITAGKTATINVDNGSSLRFSGSVPATTGGITKTGAGTLALAGTMAYTGSTTASAGTLQFAKTTALYNNTPASWTAANLTAANGATIAFNVDTAGTAGFTAGNVTTLLTNLDRAVDGNGLLAGSTIGFDTGTATGGVFTIADLIANTTGTGGGAVGLRKLGAGTLTLQGNNSFTGGVTISGGAVSVTSIGNGGQAGNLGKASKLAANLVLDGGSLVYNASGSTGSDRGMTVTANGGTFVNANADSNFFLTNGSSAIAIAQSGVFTVDGPGSTAIINTFSGAGALRKTGEGTLALENTSNSFTGGVTISGGTLAIQSLTNGGVASNLGAATADPANLVFDGGTLSLNGSASTSDRGFTISAGQTATLDVAGSSSLSFSGSVPATTGGLTKTGTGTLALAGNLAYTGATTVSAGTLEIDGITAFGANVTVAAGATLGGSGTIGSMTIINGTHRPGSSPGVQTFNNSLIYNDGSSVTWDLAANTVAGRGTNYDGINVDGTVAFNGTVTLNLDFNAAGSAVNWADPFWSTDRQWDVYALGGTTTGFDHLNLASIDWADSTGALFSTALPGSAFILAQQGGSIVLTYTGVPEPTTCALVIMGASALWFSGRRRRRG